MTGRRLMTAMLACAVALREPCLAAQSLPRDPAAWTVHFVVLGGLAGITREVTVASSGSIVVEDRGADRVDGHASPQTVAKIAAFLGIARDEKPPTRPPMPDAGGTALTATVGGREYPLEVTPEIAAVLNAAADALRRHAAAADVREPTFRRT